ncbi:MAG: hypothetical protein LUI06_10715 [Ruminococcus sp.]|nr:hypothetical protein [Ruminococcus sp.]
MTANIDDDTTISENDEMNILYRSDTTELQHNYLHIYGVRKVNDYINVCVYSDKNILELYINGIIRSRQKNEHVFDFYETVEKNGATEIKVVCTDNPDIFEKIVVDI